MDDRTPGQQIESALASMVRWASRDGVRRQMLGPVARDLSANDVWLLGTLADRGPIRASELARLQGVDKSTVTTQVGRLLRHGLASREGDPDDGRAVLLTASERGRQVHAEISVRASTMIDEALAAWPEDERQTLGVLFERLTDAITTRDWRPASGELFADLGPA